MQTALFVAYMVIAAFCGIIFGVALAETQLGLKHCVSRGYQDFEVLPDWSIRCLTVVPADGGKP